MKRAELVNTINGMGVGELVDFIRNNCMHRYSKEDNTYLVVCTDDDVVIRIEGSKFTF